MNMTKINKSTSNVVVLLTACINPGAIIKTARLDPVVRLADYKLALKEWCLHSGDAHLVFCENSGYDLAELKEIARTNARSGKNVEFLSFNGQDFSSHLGKGYGEMRIIEHALEKSEIIKSASLILKVTGRLFVRNNQQLIQELSESTLADVYCDLQSNLSMSDSRVFCATAPFIEKYLLPRAEEINDSAHMIFEIVLARAIHSALAEGWRWSLLPLTPGIVGVAGTSNKSISDSITGMLLSQIFRRVKGLVLAR